MTKLRRKIWKVLTAIFLALILIVLAGFGLIYFVAQSYLNKNISEFIAKKSQGKYELTFENLEINFSNWGFEINQVSFHPSDSIINTLNQSAITKQFYSFSSPNIMIGNIRLIQLLVHKNLDIGEIIISHPELKIHGEQADTGDQKKNMSSLMQELKPLVTKIFKSIKIDKIELADASFDLYNLLGDTRKLANAENITIGILRFYTDSLLLPDLNRLFDAEDIYLRMHNYQNKLADSIHILNAGEVTYSLKHAKIEAKNLELKPVNKEVSLKGLYDIFVSELKMTSTHINEFYQNKSIPIDSLVLTDARIKYWPGQIKSGFKMKSIAGFNLYELIAKEFTSVSIQNFKLKNAQLTLFKAQNEQESQQELKKININLEDFLLDSLSGIDTSRIFYSRNIDFSATEYELTLGDNIHRIKAGQLDFSTLKKSVLLQNIQMYPVLSVISHADQINTINASCDSVRLDRFYFKKAFHQNRFEFQYINLFNPEVRLVQNEISEEKISPENPSFVYNLISSYVKGIYSNQVYIQKGKLQLINKTGVLQTGHIESDIRLKLSGFALDEISARRTDRLFFANQIELNFSNYQMQLVDQLHKLTIDNLFISTQKKQASIQNLHLFPVSMENMEDLLKKYNRSELYEFTIPELTLKNADFHEAFFNKKLAVDTLNIKLPQIYYENFAQLKQEKPKAEFEDLFQLLSNYLYEIHFSTVEIPDGTVRLINHSRKGKTITLNNHFTLGLGNMLINKEQFGQKKLLYSEFVDFSVRDHLIHLSDNVHVLRAGEVGFSTRRQEIFVINARLYPETNSKDFSSITWNIQLTIPEIRIKGINMEEFYFDHKINAENLLINSPDIKLYQKRKRTDVKELKEVTFPLPKEIQSIAIRQFKLNDGSLKVFSEIGIKPYLLVQADLQMAAQNILIQKNPILNRPEFKTGEYTGKLIQFKFTPKEKNQQFSIEELSFSTNDKRITATNLLLKPKTKSNRQDQFELRIPTLTMNGFDMDNAYRNDQFLFESIVVEKPSFQLFNNEKDSLKFNPFNVNLYPHFESFADVFAANSLQVKNADIQVFKNGQQKLQQKVNINLLRLRIENQPSHGFMHSADFSFTLPNLTRTEKFYQYNFGETSYSSRENRFSVRDIQIIPKFSREKFQKQLRFQSDYYTGKIDSISIEKPDFRRWFDKEELAGQYLSVDGLNLDIYRDKRLPFDEDRRSKMLQDLIKSLKYPVLIDSLLLNNANISYTEQLETSDSEGTIRFNQIQTSLIPFTNMKSTAGIVPDFRLNGTATIMDSCQLNVGMLYRMNDPENSFTVTGNLLPFNMRILNPVLEPLAMVSLRSGKAERFEFSLSADRTNAAGQLYFGYDDMRISVLEMKNGSSQEAKFSSFLANTLLIHSRNPRGKELLPDEINFKRDEKRSVLNYWWKSIFSGIRNTLGIKEKQDQEDQ